MPTHRLSGEEQSSSTVPAWIQKVPLNWNSAAPTTIWHLWFVYVWYKTVWWLRTCRAAVDTSEGSQDCQRETVLSEYQRKMAIKKMTSKESAAQKRRNEAFRNYTRAVAEVENTVAVMGNNYANSWSNVKGLSATSCASRSTSEQT